MNSALPISARCFDDLAAAHFWLTHAILMVGLRSTTEPQHILYWDKNRLKGQFGWLHPFCSCTLLILEQHAFMSTDMRNFKYELKYKRLYEQSTNLSDYIYGYISGQQTWVITYAVA